jgi:predicted nucleic acid-binding protein
VTVIDASVMVAALVDASPVGSWAESVLASGPLAAPHLLPIETANVLRRLALAGDISSDVAALAHRDLLAIRMELFPYAPLGERVWELRQNVTSYDACYVALAELLRVPLATLDARLTRIPGATCEFRLPI